MEYKTRIVPDKENKSQEQQQITFVIEKDLLPPKEVFSLYKGDYTEFFLPPGHAAKLKYWKEYAAKFGEKPLLVEAIGIPPSKEMIQCERMHGFFATIFLAFKNHYSVELKPDHLWNVLLESFALHVSSHAEELRDKFVGHQGKKVIRLYRNSWTLNNPNNEWEGLIEEFAEEIAKDVPQEVINITTKKFTTTTSIEHVGTKVALMSAMREFFDYRCGTLCGIPSITLKGSKQDWVDLRDRFTALLKYMTKEFSDWWGPCVLEILDEFIHAYEGKVNELFWKSICKYNSTYGSGGTDYIGGWINNFYPFTDTKGKESSPYVCDWKARQQKLESKEKRNSYGRDVGNFMFHQSQAPGIWEYFGKEIPLMFKVGFVNPVLINPTTLGPCIAWGIVRNESLSATEKD